MNFGIILDLIMDYILINLIKVVAALHLLRIFKFTMTLVTSIYNQWKNFLSKIRKSTNIGQDQKTLIPAFV